MGADLAKLAPEALTGASKRSQIVIDAMGDLPQYNRVLLKISGEGFCQSGGWGVDGNELELLATEIAAATEQGVQVAVVVGGGNIIRGASLAEEGRIAQVSADYMGMLGTVINAIALKEMLEKLAKPARVMSAIGLTPVAEPFVRARAIRHLEKGRVVIFAGGTGNPFFTTDTAAALRAVEIGADVLLKATKVDGVYDKDPMQHEDAVRYDRLSYTEAVEKRLGVMDLSAISLCQQHNIRILIFNLKTPGHVVKMVAGQVHGTVISDS